MTKCVSICKNTADACEQENVEEGATTSGSNVRTVRQPTGETEGTHSIWNVTDTVMEERRVDKTPLSIQEKAP